MNKKTIYICDICGYVYDGEDFLKFTKKFYKNHLLMMNGLMLIILVKKNGIY